MRMDMRNHKGTEEMYYMYYYMYYYMWQKVNNFAFENMANMDKECVGSQN